MIADINIVVSTAGFTENAALRLHTLAVLTVTESGGITVGVIGRMVRRLNIAEEASLGGLTANV